MNDNCFLHLQFAIASSDPFWRAQRSNFDKGIRHCVRELLPDTMSSWITLKINSFPLAPKKESKYQKSFLSFDLHYVRIAFEKPLSRKKGRTTFSVGTREIRVSTKKVKYFIENGKCISCNRTATFVEFYAASSNGVEVRFCGTENGTKFHLTQDHIIPRSRGGDSRRENIQCLCNRCNLRKGKRIISINQLRKEIGINI